MNINVVTIKRKLNKIQTPTQHQGFLGPDHITRAVILMPYPDSDSFILLMDNILDKQDGEPVGGPHLHAGFETVTLLLEGEMGDAEHTMKACDLQMMTAGSGIIHIETIDTKTRMRLLQLWLNLPKQHRWAISRVQDLPAAKVPTISSDGLNIRVYSGPLAGITSSLIPR
jgi:redox-sensitive bicupin YhaK (pirin superfamily)